MLILMLALTVLCEYLCYFHVLWWALLCVCTTCCVYVEFDADLLLMILLIILCYMYYGDILHALWY